MAKKSGLFKLGWADAVKSLLMAVLSAVLDGLLQMLSVDNASLKDINWQRITTVAVVATLAYLLKNLGTNSDDKFLKKEDKNINPYV